MNKHPADIILEYLKAKSQPIGDNIIARETGISKSVVEYWITEMERMKPLWIRSRHWLRRQQTHRRDQHLAQL